MRFSIAETPKAKRHALAGNPALWEMKRAFQIDFLKKQGLQPDHDFLDLGCATLRGGIPIINHLNVAKYTGCDIRIDSLKEAEKELAEEQLQHKNVHLVHLPSFKNYTGFKTYDCIWAFSVLIHMHDFKVEKCFRFVSNHLKPTGAFYANVNIGVAQEQVWQDFPVVSRSEKFYRLLAEKNGLVMQPLGALKQLGHFTGAKKQDRQVMLKFSLKK
ncbi:MAG: class I SAM-dependent methyltransferase [Flavobacteriales bacterium]